MENKPQSDHLTEQDLKSISGGGNLTPEQTYELGQQLIDKSNSASEIPILKQTDAKWGMGFEVQAVLEGYQPPKK
jgi:hypothetical protein